MHVRPEVASKCVRCCNTALQLPMTVLLGRWTATTVNPSHLHNVFQGMGLYSLYGVAAHAVDGGIVDQPGTRILDLEHFAPLAMPVRAPGCGASRSAEFGACVAQSSPRWTRRPGLSQPGAGGALELWSITASRCLKRRPDRRSLRVGWAPRRERASVDGSGAVHDSRASGSRSPPPPCPHVDVVVSPDPRQAQLRVTFLVALCKPPRSWLPWMRGASRLLLDKPEFGELMAGAVPSPPRSCADERTAGVVRR